MPIPKIIIQTCNFKNNEIPDYINTYTKSWKDKNPEWEYKYFNDDDIDRFIFINFPEQIDIYRSIKIPFVKADFWRYFALYHFGGFYADIDTICLSSIDEWANLNKDFLVSEHCYPDNKCYNCTLPDDSQHYQQWAFATSPQNIFIKSIIDEMLNRIKNSRSKNDYEINTFHTSPFMFTAALKKILPNDNFISMPPNFDNNVLHINASTRWSDSQEDKKLLHTHYWNKNKKIEIKITTNGYGSGVSI